MTTTLLDRLKQPAATHVRTVSRQFHQWTRPLTRTPVGGALADAVKTKPALRAENALLRQQLTHPVLTPRDRVQFVVLARLIRTWQSALHIGVTRHPTDAWVAQQLCEATPFGTAPRCLIRDNDIKFGPQFARLAAASGIEILRTPIAAPRANAIVERFLGSVQRECLDHVLILSERHLLRTLRAYSIYFNTARPHQGVGQALPEPVAATPEASSADLPLRAVPMLGGLHHDYQRVA